ncbi:hypothetical protein [Steroidobacter agaridevorans]|nr:hypothetical protein [Steroidobacter agaridevorans]
MATCTSISCEDESILAMMTTSTGDVYVKTSGDMSSLSCTRSQGVYATLIHGTEGFKQIYATLLAHYMAGMPISIRINENSIGCTIGYVYTEAGS